jgi:hypothetical protein
MSLLSVVNDVCRVVGVHEMTSVINNTRDPRTAAEMLSLANEMAQRIAYDTREWQALKATKTFVGDGVLNPVTHVIEGSLSFPLPTDFKRMLLTANVWRSTSLVQPMRFVPDLDEYNLHRARGYFGPWGEWTIVINAMWIQPTMAAATATAAAVTATFAYLQKNCVQLNSVSSVGDHFTNDGDTFLLDERLLKLGMIWQWKAQKGSPYAEDMASYETALARAAGADSPAPIIVDRLPISQYARVAFPWPSTWP